MISYTSWINEKNLVKRYNNIQTHKANVGKHRKYSIKQTKNSSYKKTNESSNKFNPNFHKLVESPKSIDTFRRNGQLSTKLKKNDIQDISSMDNLQQKDNNIKEQIKYQDKVIDTNNNIFQKYYQTFEVKGLDDEFYFDKKVHQELFDTDMQSSNSDVEVDKSDFTQKNNKNGNASRNSSIKKRKPKSNKKKINKGGDFVPNVNVKANVVDMRYIDDSICWEDNLNSNKKLSKAIDGYLNNGMNKQKSNEQIFFENSTKKVIINNLDSDNKSSNCSYFLTPIDEQNQNKSSVILKKKLQMNVSTNSKSQRSQSLMSELISPIKIDSYYSFTKSHKKKNLYDLMSTFTSMNNQNHDSNTYLIADEKNLVEPANSNKDKKKADVNVDISKQNVASHKNIRTNKPIGNSNSVSIPNYKIINQNCAFKEVKQDIDPSKAIEQKYIDKCYNKKVMSYKNNIVSYKEKKKEDRKVFVDPSNNVASINNNANTSHVSSSLVNMINGNKSVGNNLLAKNQSSKIDSYAKDNKVMMDLMAIKLEEFEKILIKANFSTKRTFLIKNCLTELKDLVSEEEKSTTDLFKSNVDQTRSIPNGLMTDFAGRQFKTYNHGSKRTDLSSKNSEVIDNKDKLKIDDNHCQNLQPKNETNNPVPFKDNTQRPFCNYSNIENLDMNRVLAGNLQLSRSLIESKSSVNTAPPHIEPTKRTYRKEPQLFNKNQSYKEAQLTRRLKSTYLANDNNINNNRLNLTFDKLIFMK